MADQFRYKLMTDLTAKDAPSDTDLVAVGNNGSSALRKLTFASIANAIKTKLASWTFSNLTTSSKTLPGAVNELNSKIAPVIALTYDSSISRFVPPSGTAKLANAQLTFVARNTNTGAIYVLYYIYSDNNFAVAATISGSAPSNGNLVQIMAVR